MRTDYINISSDANNTANTAASLTLPLLKGFGYISAAAGETSARLKAEGAEFNFYHQVSGFLLEAIKAYWNYKAAIERLKIQQASERMVQQWVNDAGTGIQQQGGATNQYQDETAQIEAYLNYKHKNTLAASEEVNATRGQLTSVMGIPYEQMKKIGTPAETFPEDWSGILAKLESKPVTDMWINVAMQNRLDLKAAKREEQATSVELAKAEHDILPQLDLGLNYSFDGMEIGDGFNRHIDAIDSDIHSSTTGANLSFSYPIENRGARAAREGARIGHRVSVLSTRDAERQVGIDVSTVTETVLGRLKTAVEAKKTVESYLPAIQKLANVNLRNNPEAIFDFINIEKRYNEAQASPANEENSYINSLRDLAIAIAELRHKTGTLVIGGEIGKDVELGALATLPAID
jgi:outer membrane protein TolC